jgi:hypothetical protein
MPMRDLEPVRLAVYATLVAEGRAPSVLELARLTERSPDQVGQALRELAARHALVLTPAGDAVRMAHPFSAAPMGFVVAPLDGRDDRLWWGGCAWDSFGISAAMTLDVLITTTCPSCGRRHEIAAGPELAPPPGTIVHFLVPAARWWDDVVHACSHIRLFCSADHVATWAADSGRDVGAIVPVQAVWRLARPWYGDRLRADFVPHTTARNQGILAGAGLAGDFWTLP